MGAFEELLLDFGRRLGLEGLNPGPGGGVDLLIEKIGRLQLEADGIWLLATLARPVLPHAPGQARALLDAAHWRQHHPWPIHPGMKGDEWLTLTARLPLTAADVPELERVVSALAGLHDAAGTAE